MHQNSLYRQLSELNNEGEVKFVTNPRDEKAEGDYKPDFYTFVYLTRNSKPKVVRTNKDLFLIWGQNGIIGAFMMLSYLIVWIFQLGASKSKILKKYVFISRTILKLFFVKMQLLSLVEISSHNILVPQRVQYDISYWLSALFTQIFFIEMLRSWMVVRKGYTMEEVDKDDFHNEEHKMMVKLWTSDLKESERKLGNTY